MFKELDNGKELQRKHDLQRVLNLSPNDYQTRNTYLERAAVHYLLWGNHYAKPEKPAGRVSSLRLIHPENVEVSVEDGFLQYKIYQGPKNEVGIRELVEVLSPDEIIHVPNLGDGIKGKGVLQNASQDMGWALANRKFGSNFFKTGGKMSAVIEQTQQAKIGNDKEAIKKFRKEFNDLYSKADGENVGILPFGLSYKPQTMPADDFQFISTHHFQTEVICRWFNVDQEMVQATNSTNYAQYTAINEAFAKKTLQPITEKFEAEYTRKLFPKGDFFSEFDYSRLLKTDPKTRAEVTQKKIFSGQMTPNEARTEDGMNASDQEGMNSFYMQSGNIRVDQMEGFWANKGTDNE